MLILTIKLCASSRVTLVLVSAPKNPQPMQNTTTRDNSVPAFLKIKQAVWYMWLHWNACSGLPISGNWTSFASCYGWSDTSENRLKNGVFKGTRSVWPKISGTRGHPLQPFSFEKTRWMDLLYSVRILGADYFVLSQSMRLTDGQTERWQHHAYGMHLQLHGKTQINDRLKLKSTCTLYMCATHELLISGLI